MFLCCKILKQRKATGQECAEAHDCPVNLCKNIKIFSRGYYIHQSVGFTRSVRDFRLF